VNWGFRNREQQLDVGEEEVSQNGEMNQMIQADEADRRHLENSGDLDGRVEGRGQVQVGQHRSPMEQRRTKERIERTWMTEEGRERTDLRSAGAEMERGGRRENKTTRPRRDNKGKPNGNAESANGRQEQQGEEKH